MSETGDKTDNGTTPTPGVTLELEDNVTRQRNYTEKGLQYQIDQKQQKFRSLISQWRKCAGKIECLLSEQSTEVPSIKKERDLAMSVMSDISNVYYDLDQLLLLAGSVGSNYEVFEKVECDHLALIKRVTEFIKDVEGSESRSKSHSRSSRSGGSSLGSNAEAKAASLRAKLSTLS